MRLTSDAGEVDVLVNNAGRYAFAPTAQTDAAGFDRHSAVNTRAPFLLVGALAPAMAGREHGAVITIGSSAARTPAPIGAAYGASEAGVEILTRYWATEFGGSGVRVNAVSPGPVKTDGTSDMFGDQIAVLDQVNAPATARLCHRTAEHTGRPENADDHGRLVLGHRPDRLHERGGHEEHAHEGVTAPGRLGAQLPYRRSDRPHPLRALSSAGCGRRRHESATRR